MTEPSFTLTDVLIWAENHVSALHDAHVAAWHVLRAEMIRDGLGKLMAAPPATLPPLVEQSIASIRARYENQYLSVDRRRAEHDSQVAAPSVVPPAMELTVEDINAINEVLNAAASSSDVGTPRHQQLADLAWKLVLLGQRIERAVPSVVPPEPQMVRCRECRGLGRVNTGDVENSTDWETCMSCRGSGTVAGRVEPSISPSKS